MSIALKDAALDTNRPFTVAAGLAAGLTRSTLRGPLFRRILHGVYIAARVPVRARERIEAALLVHPDGAWASHASAARVYRLPVPARCTDEHVTVRRRQDRRARREVVPHLAAELSRACLVAGLPVSRPLDLFLELAGLLNLVELVVVGDAMVRLGLVSRQELVDAMAVSHDPHARAARRAATYVRAEVDSPMESRLRMLLVLAGLPEPRVNFKLLYDDGRVRYRLDLSYPELQLAVEYDGRHHRDDDKQHENDVDRDEWLDYHGWMLTKVFSRGIQDFDGTAGVKAMEDRLQVVGGLADTERLLMDQG
ncbi:hypothetical protein [Nocardioides mesophilus]|uniref:DUF559 domain-containing protein n=1 Tax=Nocardioides mesophilus TaxID=433659 RepID=A0A7G9RC55_9ACTN|nr:hypothetical protein [Nocardioides mesophilus]QNN53180.1 hypothetical protein H9L09_01410 [Nocardioides mesophilus]